ncbi:MAG TPA: YggT family protein [Candidatus Dormibacteraeota bacterium]|nr:YggT family protein [Candidatus Dormibacteraeota bacterium]
MICNPLNPGPLPGLVSAAFSILELLVFARVMLSWLPISPWNPIARWLRRIVDPILRPFRRVLPSFGGIDFSPLLCLAVLYVLQSVVNTLLLSCGISPVNAILSVVRQVALGIVVFFCIVLFVRLLFSLFHADPWHPIVLMVRRFTDPLVRPFVTVVPRGAAIDGGAAIAFLVFLVLFFVGRALFDAAGIY